MAISGQTRARIAEGWARATPVQSCRAAFFSGDKITVPAGDSLKLRWRFAADMSESTCRIVTDVAEIIYSGDKLKSLIHGRVSFILS